MNKILVVGIPKSGTHALQKACTLLGVDASHHLHTANYKLALTNNVGYIYRNPRDVLISALRYRNHQRRGWTHDLSEEKLIDCFFSFFNCSMAGVYTSYAKWMDTDACIVKFEDLISDPLEMKKIADYMGVPMQKHDELMGGTYTWTGELSDWRKHWTDGIDKVWKEEGMVEIEQSLGYING